MERRFDMSDFEQSLKDHADQFKMIPSKRVWNGIYNNLHPGSKWPSITVAILFLITLIIIGNPNNTPSHFNTLANTDLNSTKNISKAKNENQAANQLSDQNKRKVNSTKINVKNILKSSSQEKINPQTKNSLVKHLVSPNTSSEKDNHQTVAQLHLPANNISINDAIASFQPKNDFNNSNTSVNQQIGDISILSQSEDEQTALKFSTIPQPDLFNNDLVIPVSYNIFSSPPDESLYVTAIPLKQSDETATNDAALKQNTVLNTKKLHRKRNNKIEWVFYVNPTVSTVSFDRKTIQPLSGISSIMVLSNQSSFKLVHNKKMGMETGAEMSFKLFKRFRFITGINLNYSGYTNVSNLVHPTFTSLTLNDKHGQPYSQNYITHYGNGQSQDHISLRNYNIEASIPVGIQYNIWGNKKIKIDVASLLEPSFLLKKDAYLISSDGRYYVNDPSLVRKANLEANFGTYITFAGKNIKWHLGPNVRYQLLSTYKNIYPAKEHLIDYGIRIGISR
jgi:hypothetical protein